MRLTEDGEMAQDGQLEVDEVVWVNLRYPTLSIVAEITAMTSLMRTQYLVVCLTNALWFPPALASP